MARAFALISKICRGKNLIQFTTLTNEINKTDVWETVHIFTSPTFDVFTFACRPEKQNRGTTGLGLGLGLGSGSLRPSLSSPPSPLSRPRPRPSPRSKGLRLGLGVAFRVSV